jgi:lipoprotein-anchoring transpeptidase ErfK/SrfK
MRSVGLARFRTILKAVRTIQWAREHYTFTQVARTRCIHGTNNPILIGHGISSGCIRLTNEDVIDLYSRVKIGTRVVVLGPVVSHMNARAP